MGERTMSLHSWLQNLRSALAPARGQRHRGRPGSPRAATHRPNLEVLEGRCVPALYAVTDLGGGHALDLNEASQVVGYYGAASDGSSRQAILWENGTAIELGTLGGSYSYAQGINESGQVVGAAALPGNTTRHAFLIT